MRSFKIVFAAAFLFILVMVPLSHSQEADQNSNAPATPAATPPQETPPPPPPATPVAEPQPIVEERAAPTVSDVAPSPSEVPGQAPAASATPEPVPPPPIPSIEAATPTPVSEPLSIAAIPRKATANLSGTQGGSEVNGRITFQDTVEGLLIIARLNHIPNDGKHGFHIHENGSCGNNGNAAGDHFNPDGTKHGFLPSAGLTTAHPGDMGNINIRGGRGVLRIILPGVTLTGGKYNVAEKAVILHEKEDDFGQPTGNAGSRIGCGIITLD